MLSHVLRCSQLQPFPGCSALWSAQSFGPQAPPQSKIRHAKADPPAWLARHMPRSAHKPIVVTGQALSNQPPEAVFNGECW